MTILDTLSILQYNVRKSFAQVMALIFADSTLVSLFDIIVIQEPWRNIYQNITHHPQKDFFYLAYPDHPQARVCFFVNKRLKLGSWSIIFYSANLNLAANPDQEHIVVGNFNLHHHRWGGLYARADNESEDLIILSRAFDLNLLIPPGTIPPGTITYEEGPDKSTIDLIYATYFLSNSVIKCDISEIDHHSDHLPIETHFQMSLAVSIADTPRKNWKMIDCDTFSKAVVTNIENSPILSHHSSPTLKILRQALIYKSSHLLTYYPTP